MRQAPWIATGMGVYLYCSIVSIGNSVYGIRELEMDLGEWNNEVCFCLDVQTSSTGAVRDELISLRTDPGETPVVGTG